MKQGYSNIKHLRKEEQSELKHLIRGIESLGIIRPKAFYIVDLQTKKVLYASALIASLVGLDSQEKPQEELSIRFLRRYAVLEEHDQLQYFERSALSFWRRESQTKASEDFMYYTFSFELSLAIGLGGIYTYNAKPIAQTPQGDVRWTLVQLEPSSYGKVGTVRLNHIDHLYDYWRPLGYGVWERREGIRLDDRERAILLYSMQGFKEDYIASKVNLSKARVKQLKRAIMSKLSTQSVGQSIARSLQFGVLI